MPEQLNRNFEERIAKLEREIQLLRVNVPRSDKATIVIFSDAMDKVLAGLIIATAAASLEMETTLFFTFWGINALKERRACAGKDVLERVLECLTPAGPKEMGISHMNLLGAGAAMLRKKMKEKNVLGIEELLDVARETNVRIYACSMSMHVMGISQQELISEVEVAGVATYLQNARHSGVTLFI